MQNIQKLDTNFGDITFLKKEAALKELIFNAWEEVQLKRSNNFLIEIKNRDTLTIINTTKLDKYLTTDNFVIKSNTEKKNNNMIIGGNGWGLNAAISTLYKECRELKIISGKNIYKIYKENKTHTSSEVIYVEITENEEIQFEGTAVELVGVTQNLINFAKKYYYYTHTNDNSKEFNSIYISNSGTNCYAVNNLVLGRDSKLLFSYNFLTNKDVDIKNSIGKKRTRKLPIIDYIVDVRETILSILNKSINEEIQAYIIDKFEKSTLENSFYELDSLSNFSNITEIIAVKYPGLILTTCAEKSLVEKHLDEVDINNIVVINKDYEKYYASINSVNYTKGSTIISKNHKYKKDKNEERQILLDNELLTALNESEKDVLNIYPCLLAELGIYKSEYKVKVYENASNLISFEEVVKDDDKKEIKISRTVLSSKLYFTKKFIPVAVKLLNINPKLNTEQYITYLCEEIIERRAQEESCIKE